MTLVLDATPLIHLAKAGALRFLRELDEERIVPKAVHREVVEHGVGAGHPDAGRVAREVREGHLEVRVVEGTKLLDRLARNRNLSRADAEVLALAGSAGGIAVTDESYGRGVAESEGIRHRGMIYLVLEFVRGDAIAADEARGVIDDVVEQGWYCSTDLYARVLQRLEEFRPS